MARLLRATLPRASVQDRVVGHHIGPGGDFFGFEEGYTHEV